MSKHIAERMCIGCRRMCPKTELIRVVIKDGEVEVDRASNKPGRGAYFCRDIKCLQGAQKKKALSRHFKSAIPDKIYDEIKEILDG